MEKNKNISPLECLRPTEQALNALVGEYRDRLIKRSSDTIRNSDPEKQDQFLSRIISSIIKNELLKECFNSAEGKVSIYTLIDDCLRTGLLLDKHAYAIPYNKKTNKKDASGKFIWVKTASLQIKRQGFHALLCGGEKPIFKDLKWGVVYEKEKDNITINRATGEIDHPISIEATRGNPIGCWVQAIKKDGSKEAEFYPVTFINNIRDNHSKTHQDFKAGKKDYYGNLVSSPWITDPIPMIEKTAIKSFCNPYADVCEELSNALYSEKETIIPEKKDIEDVADIIIDNAIINLDEKNNIEHDIIEEKDDEVIENKDNKSIF